MYPIDIIPIQGNRIKIKKVNRKTLPLLYGNNLIALFFGHRRPTCPRSLSALTLRYSIDSFVYLYHRRGRLPRHASVCQRTRQTIAGSITLTQGAPSADTYERVFKLIKADSLQEILETYGKEILNCLAEKQIVLDGKKLRGVSPTSKGNSGLYILWCVGKRESFLYRSGESERKIRGCPEAPYYFLRIITL
jgi:hypothetical protein